MLKAQEGRARGARAAVVLLRGVPVAVMSALAGTAGAAVPTGAFLNPNDDGPGAVVSDQPDGTDGTYHFVVRATDPDGGTITGVVLQIEDGDADNAFETIGAATRVGTTDTWELAGDVSAHTPVSDVGQRRRDRAGGCHRFRRRGVEHRHRRHLP